MKCDRCGHKSFLCSELRSIYQRKELKVLCDECGVESNAFINYYGKKKKKDLDRLFRYLVSGSEQVKKFNQMMNAGYGYELAKR